MTELLIVYHSKTGGSRQMAEAAATAAEGEAPTVTADGKRQAPGGGPR